MNQCLTHNGTGWRERFINLKQGYVNQISLPQQHCMGCLGKGLAFLALSRFRCGIKRRAGECSSGDKGFNLYMILIK